MSVSVVVAYHSGYGHTEVVAKSVVLGAQNAGANVTLLPVATIDEAGWAALDAADAIIFGAPTYMGGVSAPFKTFIDAASGRWMKRTWKDKIAAGFSNSGSYSGDKLSSLLQLYINAMQHGMIWVGQAEMATNNSGADRTPDDINRVGSFSGLMTQANNDSPDKTPPAGDHETAKRFGARVVQVTERFKKGAA